MYSQNPFTCTMAKVNGLGICTYAALNHLLAQSYLYKFHS